MIMLVRWRRNFFQVPSGKAGKEFIGLISKALNSFTSKSSFESFALKMVMILPPLLLVLLKPSHRSKTKDHINS
jgi:hypothetical protein